MATFPKLHWGRILIGGLLVVGSVWTFSLVNLGGQFKSGQLVGLQLCPPAPRPAFEDMVVVQEAVEHGGDVFPSGGTRYKDERGILKLKIDFVNSGKTPAKCESWSFEGVAPTINPPTFPKTPPNEKQSIFFLAPNLPMGVFEDAHEPSPKEVALIEKGAYSLYLCGEIHYMDVFEKRHTTKFRFVSSRDDFSAGRFVFCRDGNDAN